MSDLFEFCTEADHYEAALEAGCDTLMTLQLIQATTARSSGEGEDVEPQLTRAIGSLRRAIAELRLARTEQRDTVVDGFVLASERRQSKPRRTA